MKKIFFLFTETERYAVKHPQILHCDLMSETRYVCKKRFQEVVDDTKEKSTKT